MDAYSITQACRRDVEVELRCLRALHRAMRVSRDRVVNAAKDLIALGHQNSPDAAPGFSDDDTCPSPTRPVPCPTTDAPKRF